MRRKTITGAASVKQWKRCHSRTTHRVIRLTAPISAVDHVQAIADLIGVSRAALLVHLMCTAGPASDELRQAVEGTAARLGTRIALIDENGAHHRLGGPR